MEFVPLLALLALITKFGDWIKQARNKDWNAFLTQLVMFSVSVVLVTLVARSNFADGIAIGDSTLADINVYGLVFVGLFVGSGSGLVHDYLQARDNNNVANSATLKMFSDDTAPTTKVVKVKKKKTEES